MTAELSLRDYFAAKAMAAMIAHHGVYDESQPLELESSSTQLGYHGQRMAEMAYVFADAMLKTRALPPSQPR